MNVLTELLDLNSLHGNLRRAAQQVVQADAEQAAKRSLIISSVGMRPRTIRIWLLKS